MIKNKKVKKFISICLCMILLFGMGVQQTFAEGENSEVEKSEEIIQDEQDVADKNITIDNEQPDNQEENTEVSDTETSQEDSEQQEVLEIRKDEIITSMDEDGNITEIESENGTLEDEGISLLDGESSAKIVNFNTKGSAVTEYQEYGTGYDGYTNGMYGADAAYLGDENGKVKFMLSGVIGLVNPGEVQVVDINQASSLSYYTVSNGRLIHKITTNITKASYASSLDNGPAPNYLQESGTYYSYDGHYFYTRENFSKMIDDYNGGTRTNAINADNPYYNYFQYLPLRSKTAYTTDQLNNVLNSKIAGRTSAMTNMAGTFLNYQNQYGVNALIAIGVAANESAWGTSNIARNKNNLFGLNAVDTSPGQSANTYSSVDSCVKTFMETYMSKRYLNPNAGVYAGGYLGNKASGMNVKYASDPYWGEKNANIVWMIDKTYSNSEYANYTLAVKDTIGTEHTNLNVRKEASTSSTRIHTTKKYSNQSFIVLGNQNGFYKVQSDGALNSERSAISDSGNYNYDNMYVYVSDSYVKIVLEGKNGNGGNSEEISVPDSVKDVLEYEGYVQENGWSDSAKNGQIIGTTGKNLSLNAIKLNVNDLDGIGIEYRTHISDIGWQDTVKNGEQSGTAGQSNWIEAVQIKLTGNNASNYDIYYRSHVSEIGWLDWAKNGELSGTQGYGYAVQAIQIVLLPKGDTAPGSTLVPFKIGTVKMQYQAHVQDIGWQDWCYDGETAGTQTLSKRVEAIEIQIVDKIKEEKVQLEIENPSATIKNEKQKVQGWIMTSVPDVKLNVLIDGEQLDLSNLKRTYRQDVLNNQKGYGNESIYNKTPGFELEVDFSKYTIGTHKIAVQAIKNDKVVKKVQKTFEIKKNIFIQKGTYGYSGLKLIGDWRGSELPYYQYGSGPNVFYATFAIHGFEDLWSYDGKELVEIANNFYQRLVNSEDSNLADKWTIYIFPGVNQDGLKTGWTNDGPGRTTIYSQAPGNQGIDMNRCWQIGNSYTRYTDSRNYNGTTGFQAYEAAYLRNFLINHKSKTGKTVLVDLHGWTQQLIGDSGICSYYRQQFPENDGSAIGRYGTGYLVNWARSTLGARSALIELPSSGVNGHQAVVNKNFSNRYINATLNMLKNI